ncbi:MAG TPA: ATP-binding protein [Thermoanaerobaculia bacterium]|nr:ATP-binding protein [Thermoanaerobaculia bacterium]
MFDRFYTHRPNAARQEAGHTGLGLSIVSSIVDAYGGTVVVTNGERGAVFTVRLPKA